MLKFFNKKLRNKKGFTLIELIVVIAILGILAGIAIPKFSGFTDKAKDAADEQLAAICRNALSVAIASGDVVVAGDETVTITYASSALVYTPTGTDLKAKNGTTALTKDTLRDEMVKLVDDKELQNSTNIVLTVNADGEVTSSVTK